MGGNDGEVVEVSAERLRSIARQLADLRALADLVVIAVADGSVTVKDATRLRDGFGSVGVQVHALVRRRRDEDAEVREIRPRGQDAE